MRKQIKSKRDDGQEITFNIDWFRQMSLVQGEFASAEKMIQQAATLCDQMHASLMVIRSNLRTAKELFDAGKKVPAKVSRDADKAIARIEGILDTLDYDTPLPSIRNTIFSAGEEAEVAMENERDEFQAKRRGMLGDYRQGTAILWNPNLGVKTTGQGGKAKVRKT